MYIYIIKDIVRIHLFTYDAVYILYNKYISIHKVNLYIYNIYGTYISHLLIL
jgi:hypothetical protein